MSPAISAVIDRRVAAIGNVHDIDAGRVLEQLRTDAAKTPSPLERVVRAAGLGLGLRDQLAIVSPASSGLPPARRSSASDLVTGAKSLIGSNGSVLYSGRRVACALVCSSMRVAVGRRFRDRVGADVAAGTGSIVDHHRLPGISDSLCPTICASTLDAAARRVGHDDADGAVRIVLRRRRVASTRMRSAASQEGSSRRIMFSSLNPASGFWRPR